MSWTFCTSGSAVAKAGTHCSSISGSAVTMAAWSTEAEGKIETETGMAWLDNYTELATGIKGQLADVCSSLIAMKLIAYDTRGYYSREADALLNVNDDLINSGMKSLKDLKASTKLKKPA